ncbi:MAG: type II toxin-antitoxin system VapC family toxin [Candidatus Hydrogenedentota bacterium]
MRLLLDTCVLLWWLANDDTLSEEARKGIRDSRNLACVSAVSAWEISIKHALGKLKTPEDLAGAIEASGFEELPVTIAHALAAGRLPRHHDDPFDRMLVAQAQTENLTLITRDRRLARYKIPTITA